MRNEGGGGWGESCDSQEPDPLDPLPLQGPPSRVRVWSLALALHVQGRRAELPGSSSESCGFP